MALMNDPARSGIHGDRFNSGKPKLSMLLDAPNALEGAARVLEYGEGKYARGNWLKGLPWTEILDSLLRHAKSFNAGEDLNEESGLPHADHMLVNALFLAEMAAIRPDLDDRTLSRVDVGHAELPDYPTTTHLRSQL